MSADDPRNATDSDDAQATRSTLGARIATILANPTAPTSAGDDGDAHLLHLFGQFQKLREVEMVVSDQADRVRNMLVARYGEPLGIGKSPAWSLDPAAAACGRFGPPDARARRRQAVARRCE